MSSVLPPRGGLVAGEVLEVTEAPRRTVAEASSRPPAARTRQHGEDGHARPPPARARRSVDVAGPHRECTAILVLRRLRRGPGPHQLPELGLRPGNRLWLAHGRVDRETHRLCRPADVPEELARIGDARVRGETRLERRHPVERLRKRRRIGRARPTRRRRRRSRVLWRATAQLPVVRGRAPLGSDDAKAQASPGPPVATRSSRRIAQGQPQDPFGLRVVTRVAGLACALLVCEAE